MKLTIVTVNLNNREGLLRTARSIAEQTFEDYEWIVVDGGSTDGSIGVLSYYPEHLSWSVCEHDGGIYDAMNKGTAKARGEYIQFLNSGDSFIDGSVLEKVFKDKELADVNYGDQWCIQGDLITEKRSYPKTMDLMFLFRNPLGHQAAFLRTALVKAHPYRTEYTISADRALFLELYLSGAAFHYLDLPVVYFDTEGIGSREDTLELRREQFSRIKKELLPPPVVADMEHLMRKSDEYDFVMRVAPLRWMYSFFKCLQRRLPRIR